MKKTSIEITSEEHSILYDITCNYGESIGNIEDGDELIKANEGLKVAFKFLEKVRTKLNGKKKFGKIEFKEGLILEGADKKDVEDWCEVRKVFTERAFNSFLNECKTNNFPVYEAVKIAADKGWKGFEVKWCNNLKHGREQTSQTAVKPYTFDIGRATETLISQGTGRLSTDTEG
ncbi:hypothetical protein [Myroides odoratimimus]|uniref:hypothetical protein n=1 Tax=Myroides odoratimimus TaxID=76832 RepID=UPI0025786532|nr:hypothetical protein [Myroides odoratimimus]MDM1093405.1 hypothetical protein [Myroides odoratimimus]